MAVPVEAMPLASLVDLVNGWGSTPRREAGEENWPYPPMDRLAGRLGVAGSATPVTDERLVLVADQLHPVFAAGHLAERALLVNQLLARTAVRPALRREADRLDGSWLVDNARQAVLAAAAVSLRAYLVEHSGDRLGVCAGRSCADVYVDASPSGHRRFCSLTCQNRARVAAFRARRAGRS